VALIGFQRIAPNIGWLEIPLEVEFFTIAGPQKADIFRKKSGKVFLCQTGTGKRSRKSGRNRTLPDIRSVPNPDSGTRMNQGLNFLSKSNHGIVLGFCPGF
jgi:hypothetical protein